MVEFSVSFKVNRKLLALLIPITINSFGQFNQSINHSLSLGCHLIDYFYGLSTFYLKKKSPFDILDCRSFYFLTNATRYLKVSERLKRLFFCVLSFNLIFFHITPYSLKYLNSKKDYSFHQAASDIEQFYVN